MMPEPYRNSHGNSGVTFYALGIDFIAVQFRERTVYIYDRTRPGAEHVDAMKALAVAGEGLGTYISQHVRKEFARTLPSW